MRAPGAAAMILGVALGGGCGRIGFEQRDAAMPLDGGEPLVTDLCSALPGLAAPPVLDGALEPGLVAVPIVPEGWTSSEPLPAGIAARAAIAWVPSGLYFFVEVDDPDRRPASAPVDSYCGDAVELFVDDDGALSAPPSYDRPGTMQLIVAAPASEGAPSTYAQRFAEMRIGSWPADRFVMAPRPGGYALETLIEARELDRDAWTLASAARVGVSIAIDVSTPDGSGGEPMCPGRLGQYFLRVIDGGGEGCGLPFCDARALCTPVLE